MPNVAESTMAAEAAAAAANDDTADEAAVVDNLENAAPGKKATRSKAAAPKSKAKLLPTKSHPPYESMIRAALQAQKDKKGSSRVAILKYIMQNFQVGENATQVNVRLRQGLKRGVASGVVKQVNGTGATGSFRLADAKESPVKRASKPAVKKAAATVEAKAPAPVSPAVEKSPKKEAKLKKAHAKASPKKKVQGKQKKATKSPKTVEIPIKKSTPKKGKKSKKTGA